jgi:hypothetical protein
VTEHERQIFNLVRAELSDELIPSLYKNVLNHRMCGHCHHASLAMYNLLGGKEAGYKLQKATDEKDIIHYWLLSPTGEIIDSTIEQYTELNRPIPYSRKIDNRASYRKTASTNHIISVVKLKLAATA